MTDTQKAIIVNAAQLALNEANSALSAAQNAVCRAQEAKENAQYMHDKLIAMVKEGEGN